MNLLESYQDEKQNEFADVLEADELKLWKVQIPGDQEDKLRNLSLLGYQQ